MLFNKIITTFVLGLVLTIGWAPGVEAKRYTGKPGVSDAQAYGTLKHHIREAEQKTGLKAEFIASILSIESNMGRSTKNPHSRVKGVMQYRDSTWRGDLAKHHSKLGLPKNASVNNNRASILVGSAAMLENKQYLERTTKKRITDGDIYMSQLVGLYGAEKVIKGNPNAPISRYITVTKGNKRLMTSKGRILTVGQFRAKLNQEIKQHERRYVNVIQPNNTLLAKN